MEMWALYAIEVTNSITHLTGAFLQAYGIIEWKYAPPAEPENIPSLHK